MTVAKLVQAAFFEANARYPKLAQEWVGVAFRVGSRLPNSLLLASLQREGQLDVVIRCMEDELAPHVKQAAEDGDLFAFHYMNILAAYWVGGIYETCRLLRDRKLAEEGEPFATIFRHLEFVRVIIEKHEIPKDRELKEPLVLQKRPLNDAGRDIYLYDKADAARAHIPSQGVSERGSPMWHVIDVRNNAEFWVERRRLSDQLLALWGAPAEAKDEKAPS